MGRISPSSAKTCKAIGLQPAEVGAWLGRFLKEGQIAPIISLMAAPLQTKCQHRTWAKLGAFDRTPSGAWQKKETDPFQL